MKNVLFVVALLVLVGAPASAQVCGRVNGIPAVPTITVAPGCVGGAIVSRGGVGLFKLSRSAGTITSILVTPLGDENGDFIATVRRVSPTTVFVRTYQVGRSCPPAVPIETGCGPANITRKDADFSFEIR
ncbi:MAG: hypothetical protein AABO58_06620 [Acidobacteriota bacterium]